MSSNSHFKFIVLQKDKKSHARLGELRTPHGIIKTPTFVPVGTLASVKAITPHALKEMGAQIVLSNTYHLHLRPGEDVVEKMGGLESREKKLSSVINQGNDLISLAHPSFSIRQRRYQCFRQ